MRRLRRDRIDLDPQFAMAYAQLGVIYINLGQAVRGEENIRKAYQLRTRVSERERFYIASHYDENVTGDLEAARKDIEVWAQLYPRDPVPWANLNVVYLFLGDYDKVLTTTQTAVDLSGVKELSTNLVWAYIFVNRIDEAKALVEPAARSTDGPLYHLNLYMIDFLQHDTDGMQREAAAASSNTTWGHIALNYESDTAAYFGQFANARDFTRHAVDAAEKSDNPESAASYETDAALREALVGNMASATEYANAALALSNGKDVQAQAAFALSLAGNPAQAARMAADLAGRFPQDTIVQSNYLPTIRAAAELRDGDADKAITTLAAAAPYELGVTALQGGTTLYPAYIRGRAYMAAKQGSAAVVEFQRIIDHPGVVENEIIGALARLEQARAYALLGSPSKARSGYQDFFALWKDADPDVPILRQAKAEYARLP